MKKVIILLFSAFCFAQKAQLVAGPMVGYCEMTEAVVWLQTSNSANVRMEYFDEKEPKIVYKTSNIITSKEDGFTAKLVADKITQGKKYVYSIFIDNKKQNLTYPTFFSSKKLWQYREDAPDFTVALGSCTYVNEPEVDRR
jgi:alkaline phosphatase D